MNYEKYLDPTEKPKKEVKKLELYREKMKKEKEQKITSRYERIISGREIVGKIDYGKVIPAEDTAAEQKETPPSPPAQEEEMIPNDPEIEKDKPAIVKEPKVLTKGKEKLAEEEKSSSDSLQRVDSLQKVEKAPNPFYTLKAADSGMVRYTKAHFFGDQDIINGSYIRLRLGEDMRIGGKVVPKNTVFRGIASLSQNKIEIQVDRIGSHALDGRICDQDYHPGIVIPAAKREGMEDALTRSLYQSGTGTAMDLPYELLQQVGQNIIRNKRRKQSTIRINDGYLVYITQTHP